MTWGVYAHFGNSREFYRNSKIMSISLFQSLFHTGTVFLKRTCSLAGTVRMGVFSCSVGCSSTKWVVPVFGTVEQSYLKVLYFLHYTLFFVFSELGGEKA